MKANATTLLNASKLIKSNVPKIIAVEAKNFFLESFRNQGFTDISLEKWMEVERRKKDADGAYVAKGHWAKGFNEETGKRKFGAYTKSDRNRAILVKSGDLRRSIRIVSTDWKRVVLGSDLVYAAVHNDGLQAGRGKGFKMPERRFMGNSKVLDKILLKKIEFEIKRVLSN